MNHHHTRALAVLESSHAVMVMLCIAAVFGGVLCLFLSFVQDSSLGLKLGLGLGLDRSMVQACGKVWTLLQSTEP